MFQAQHHLRGARRSGGDRQPVSQGPGGLLTEVGTKLEKPRGPHRTDSAGWLSSGWLPSSRGDPDMHMRTFGDVCGGLGRPWFWMWERRRLGVMGAAGGAGHGPQQALLSWAIPGAGGLAFHTSGTAFPTAPAFQGLRVGHGLESRPLISPGSHCPEHPDVWGLHS